MRARRIAPLLLAASCGSSEEPPSVELPVVISSGGVAACTTDLGYAVTITGLRAAVRNIEFTIEGETHESPGGCPATACGPPAFAHPGHSAGGAVTGELPGDFIVDWSEDGADLGIATLVVGDYHGANFTFRRAAEGDGLDAGDPLLGHTFVITGAAEQGGDTHAFTAILDIDEDTPMVGMPFDFEVTEATQVVLALEALTIDPVEGDTLFDLVDFAALEEGGVVSIEPGEEAHNILKRHVQVHDHYQMVVR